ncbi:MULTISPECIES: type II toxin-antitoxin system VapC family toxin [Nocardia]|uniref:type II toxin-antitoxin system VapC family toxin n=1 Tax=Nocardia TaxID=1817 RepID=UPI00245602D0|nr:MULTISPECIES: type II toxin-antitoxin system VapC family toxin [Nocardia]
MLYLLDTNVVSEARKRPHRRDRLFDEWMRSVDAVDTYLSVITVGEVTAGVLSKERKDPAAGAVLRSWLRDDLLPAWNGRILPVDQRVAQREAELQVPDPKPKADALIAATAAVHGMALATRNVADFAGTGVRIVNPWDPSTH